MEKQLERLKGQFVKGQPKKLPKGANPQIQRIALYNGRVLNKTGAYVS